MLLVIDIGNTDVKVGVIKGDQISATWRFTTDVHRMADEYAVFLLNLFPHQHLDLADIDDAIIGSVVPPLLTTFQDICQRYFHVDPVIVQAVIRTGIRVNIDNPKEVGADRVINAAAAYRLYGGPAIVVDFGTATTFDAISAEGEYVGGAIAPGIGIAAEALWQHTAKLPRIELVAPRTAIGRNSVTAMQSGVVLGYVGLVEGICRRIQHELGGSAKVIGTGGLAPTIADQTKAIDVVDLDLTLVGLRLIYELNRGPAARAGGRDAALHRAAGQHAAR